MWWNMFTRTLLPNPKARFINSSHSHEPLCKLCCVTGIDLGAVTLKRERVGEWDPLEHRSISHWVWSTPRPTVNHQFTWKVLRNVLVIFLTLISKKMQLDHLWGRKLIARLSSAGRYNSFMSPDFFWVLLFTKTLMDNELVHWSELKWPDHPFIYPENT